jgi:hypothetical protein
MKNPIRYLVPFTAAALFMVAGCNTIPVQTRQEIGVPTYPPTLPASVQILRTAPVAAHVRLGDVTLEPQSNTPVPKIEAALQKAAAKLGANAVVIVVDRTALLGATVAGGWYNRQVSPDIGRVVVGVAIRYNTQP